MKSREALFSAFFMPINLPTLPKSGYIDMRATFFFLFFFFGGFIVLYSQNESAYSERDHQLKLKSDVFTSEPDFKKAQQFFLEKQWDFYFGV